MKRRNSSPDNHVPLPKKTPPPSSFPLLGKRGKASSWETQGQDKKTRRNEFLDVAEEQFPYLRISLLTSLSTGRETVCTLYFTLNGAQSSVDFTFSPSSMSITAVTRIGPSLSSGRAYSEAYSQSSFRPTRSCCRLQSHFSSHTHAVSLLRSFLFSSLPSSLLPPFPCEGGISVPCS